MHHGPSQDWGLFLSEKGPLSASLSKTHLGEPSVSLKKLKTELTCRRGRVRVIQALTYYVGFIKWSNADFSKKERLTSIVVRKCGMYHPCASVHPKI